MFRAYVSLQYPPPPKKKKKQGKGWADGWPCEFSVLLVRAQGLESCNQSSFTKDSEGDCARQSPKVSGCIVLLQSHSITPPSS